MMCVIGQYFRKKRIERNGPLEKPSKVTAALSLPFAGLLLAAVGIYELKNNAGLIETLLVGGLLCHLLCCLALYRKPENGNVIQE